MTTSTFELKVDGGSASSADATVTGVVKELVLLDQILGTGDGTATTVGATLIGPRRTGTNAVGSDVIFGAGNGTGTGGGGNLIFQTAPAGASGSTANTLTEAMRIDGTGRVSVNQANLLSIYNTNARIQNNGHFALFSWNSAGGTSNIYFTSSRNSTPGSHTIVQNNDGLGYLTFAGSDGSSFNLETAWIGAYVDGTPAAGSVPGRLSFATAAAGSQWATERMRITSAGNVGIGVTPSYKFHVRQDNNSAATYIGLENQGTGSASSALYVGVSDGYTQFTWTRNAGTPYGGIQWNGNSGSNFYLSGANSTDNLFIQSNGGPTTFSGTGNTVIGTAALATTATSGFFWISSCAGTPTGAPAAPYTNAAALVVDTTNSKLYVRVGAAWKSVALA